MFGLSGLYDATSSPERHLDEGALQLDPRQWVTDAHRLSDALGARIRIVDLDPYPCSERH